MNILLIGSGGREHALAWKMAQSPKVDTLFVAPGSDGIALTPKTTCIDLDPCDFDSLINFAKKNKIELTVVGPEKPLAQGIVDAFTQAGLAIFGPNQKGARLEASKIFAKQMMQKAGIPTAAWAIFETQDTLNAYLHTAMYPLVIKADGLAAGKGVCVCLSLEQALHFGREIFQDKKFGSAGNQVLVEECLIGRECSILAITDGSTITLLESAQDHKRLRNQDQGPNTGGMGAYSPSPIFDEALKQHVLSTVFKPLLQTLKEEGIDYCGVIYAGLMITDKGPYVLEFNARFGDPETQAILPRIQSDLVDVFLAATQKKLDEIKIQWSLQSAITVVLASPEYPETSNTSRVITGLDQVPPTSFVFHAGSKYKNGQWLSHGGRILSITTLGETVSEARAVGYQNLQHVSFEGAHYRTDIGQDA